MGLIYKDRGVCFAIYVRIDIIYKDRDVVSLIIELLC